MESEGRKHLKVVVIVSSSDVNKAMTGLMWAINARKYKWVDDVRLIFFGPIEERIAKGDESILSALMEFQSLGGSPLACKRVAEVGGYLESLENRVRVEYVGKLISDLLQEGYTPLVF